MKTLQQSFFSLLLLVFFATACESPNKKAEDENKNAGISVDKMNIDQLSEEIDKREAALNSDSMNMDQRKAARLMEAYAVYSERFPNYKNAADYLFKAGELAMGLNHTVQSIKYFQKVYNNFKDYEKRPYALFMQAFVLENQAGELERAKEVYQYFINEYPNHDMADDAEYSIQNMGKSPEELIREFEIRDSIKNAKAAS